MRSRTQIFILCLLCAVRVSKVLSEDIIRSEGKITVQDEDLRKNLTREGNESDEGNTGRLRDKRALGLLLSGLAQIFGYTVTPIQLATLANPNTTTPATTTKVNAILGKLTGPQAASSRPVSTNTTAPRRQETIKFTGVVNFGNNSDILGHLQRYEQIFHGNSTKPMTTMTTPRPVTPPKPAPNVSLDPRIISSTRPPLLTPFFVKIPLPIAPELLPTNLPVEEDLKLSYPIPLITIASEASEETPPEAPVRKGQETVYKNNKNTEHYTVEEKEIYDEEDVRKPASKYTHRLYVDEPTLIKQQDERYNEVQRKQEEHVARVKEQEVQRNRDQEDYDREDEINEKHRNREKEIAGRNRGQVPKYSSSEERRPAYDDEESAERYEEQEEQANRSNEPSERPVEKDEREKTESYPDYDEESGIQSGGYQQNNDLPAPLVDLDKLIVRYNPQLPIGDYFHQNNPENIRDSYGEVLSNKKPEDDRVSDYFSMFKPYVDGYDYQRVQDPENASQEGKPEEESPSTNGYDEHLKRVEKLREEYALPAPENKYEEYDINDEGEADRNGRQDEKDRNRSVAKLEKPKTSRVRGKEDVSAKTATGSSQNQLQRESEEAKPQEEFDFTKYTPLIVPIRYVDANDRVEQASTRRLKYKEVGKKSDNSEIPIVNNVDLTIPDKPAPQFTGLPERPRQLHEGERKDLQLWPPPFDYAFDNTERTNTVVPPNPQSYFLNHYRHETNTVDNRANSEDNPSEQPAGYLVVVGDPVHRYQHPYNIYYFPNEVLNSQDQEPRLNAASTHQQHQLYAPQQNADQRPTHATLNPTESTYNETAKSPPKYYYQPQEAAANVLNRYAFGDYGSQPNALPGVESRDQISSTENWSNRIYPSQPRRVAGQLLPTFPQHVAPPNRHEQGVTSEKRYPRPSRNKKSLRSEDQRQDGRKAKPPPRHSAPRRKPFDDPQSAHDFFGFSKNDYNFDGESDNASKASEENGKNTTESRVFGAPEPDSYHHNESTVKHTDEPENNTEKAVVREYRNKAATLRVSEQRRSRPNGPIYYVNFTRNI